MPEAGRNPARELSGLADLRVSYEGGELIEDHLPSAPLAQFEAWWQEAADSGLPEPNAMVLSTVDGLGQPTARIVLLKGLDNEGFRFFTNYASRKARAIAENPRVALVFPWFALHRQVTVLGQAERIQADENALYFRSRPRDSQLAAWASFQSAALSDRTTLERRMAELRQRWPEGTDIPVPDFWGGYRVRADSVEFWHGRRSRLHDRLRFEATVPGASLDDARAWQVRRYSP